MSEWTSAEIESAMRDVARKASTDAAFRELALRDADAAIKQLTGKTVPADYKVRFVDSQGANLVVALPLLSDEEELSDDQLEEVAAGGRCGGSCAASCGISYA